MGLGLMTVRDPLNEESGTYLSQGSSRFLVQRLMAKPKMMRRSNPPPRPAPIISFV